MAFSTRLIDYLGQGLAADRPVTPNVHADVIVLWYSTDTDELSIWAETAWLEDVLAGGTASTLDFDTDGTLAANSDAKVATQKATKTYVDAAVTGLLDYKGLTDCSANPNYPAALKGDAYAVSVAGKIGGASGTTVDVGDWFIAEADNAGGTEASVGSSWGHLEHNLIAAIVGALASTTEQLTGTDNAKLSTPDSVAALWEQGSDVASSGTISLGEGGYFNITGTTTITDIDFATDKAGRKAWVKFAGILTLTHNASTLILPTGANIATAAGDTACFVSEGSDVVRCVAYQRASGVPLAGTSTAIIQGTHTIPIPAGAMQARTTNGPASGATESSSNKVMTRSLDFDASTAEYAQISIPMPKSWDEGTIAVQFVWGASNTGDVVWKAQAQYQRDDDPIDGAWGTAQSVTDSVTAAGDRMVSAFTSAITPAGTGGNECSLLIQVYRDAANGSDTCTVDAQLIGIRVKYTINAGDDS